LDHILHIDVVGTDDLIMNYWPEKFFALLDETTT
jgi:hypothetical protein